MNRKTKLTITGAVAGVAIVVGAAASVGAATDDDNDTPITGEALDRATATALEHTGGGTVTETEVGDEDSYYEVEVTLADGSQVDVQLDESFAVVGANPDDETDDD